MGLLESLSWAIAPNGSQRNSEAQKWETSALHTGHYPVTSHVTDRPPAQGDKAHEDNLISRGTILKQRSASLT